MNNQFHNAKNPYQGKAKRVLCVCSAGLLRSPTAAFVLAKEFAYNTRACGVDIDHALIPITAVLIHWADEVVCMDKRQQLQIQYIIDEFDEANPYMGEKLNETLMTVLEVPDMFDRMNPVLQKTILEQYKVVHFGE